MFMIRPEFENERGEIILEDNKSVATEGTPRMWLMVPQRRVYHFDKIRIGLKVYFLEGPYKVAECEIIEIIGLQSNPTVDNLNNRK
jgi:hypothetical protein